jgi:hypothetical protein
MIDMEECDGGWLVELQVGKDTRFVGMDGSRTFEVDVQDGSLEKRGLGRWKLAMLHGVGLVVLTSSNINVLRT